MSNFSVLQMTTAISIEDVRREVKILKALSGHKHMIKFYDAFEDSNNVYIVMEYVFLFLHFHLFSFLIVTDDPFFLLGYLQLSIIYFAGEYKCSFEYRSNLNPVL